MLGNLKSTIKHSAIYGIGTISSKLIGFILLPLYTKHLSTYDYGILGILEVTSIFLVTVFSFNIPAAMHRWCAEEKNRESQGKIIFTSLVSHLVVVTFLVISLLPFTTELSQVFFGNADYERYFTILTFVVAFEILNLLPLELLRLREKPTLFIFATSSKLAITLGLNIYFITIMKLGVLGIILSQMIGSGILFLISVPFLIKNSGHQIDKAIAKQMIRYGFPLVFSTLSVMLLNLADKYLIAYFLDYSKLGIYSLSSKVAGVINMFVIQSFSMGFVPIAYKTHGEPNAKRFFSKIFTYFTLALTFSVILLSFFSKEIIKVFTLNPDYWEAYLLIPVLSSMFVFKGIQFYLTLSLHLVKRTRGNIIITMSGVVVNLILNILLIPVFGIYGAASASIISFIIMAFISYYLSQSLYPIEHELIKIFKLLLILIVFLVILYLINDFDYYIRIMLKVALLISFPIILYVWKFFERIEIIRVKGFIDKLLKPFSL